LTLRPPPAPSRFPYTTLFRSDGVVKLTDFGIAALLDPDEKFTVTGSILGSPSHLAPETIEGKPADPRADLFSFGTIFYWLSCGKDRKSTRLNSSHVAISYAVF